MGIFLIQKRFLIAVVCLGILLGSAITYAEETCEDICLHEDLTVPHAECMSLVGLFLQNGGYTWTNTGNRTISPDVDTWWGVTVTAISGVSHVTELVLPQNNLVGSLSSSISGLPYLQQLNIQHNEITQLPETINQLTALEQLSVSYNSLVSLPSGVFQLPELLLLEAEYNYIAELPEFNSNGTSLELLSLHHNRLQSLPESFSQLTALRQLFLHNNVFNEQPSVLFTLPELLTVHLAGNKLSGDLLSSWTALQNLIYLNIANNQLTHTQDGAVVIPQSLTEWHSRQGFVLVGDSQRGGADARIDLIPEHPHIPTVNVTPEPLRITLSEYVRSLLSSNQQPIFVVGGDSPLCQQLDVVLEITATDEILLRPLAQLPGYYAGCTLQIADFDGTLLPPWEIPAITLVAQEQIDFCDTPGLTVSPQTCHALLAFYTATHGNTRKNNAGWFVSPQVETRFGIRTQTTEGTGVTITGLHFNTDQTTTTTTTPMQGQGNGLQGLLPDIFDLLTGLETINLGNNALTGPLPSSLKTLTSLQEVYLHNNQLYGSMEGLLHPGLHILYLKNNQFTGSVQMLFSGLHHLEVVDLSKNDFYGQLPAFSSQAPVRFVNLSENAFSGLLPEQRSQANQQTHLYIHNNNLEGTLPAAWKQRTGLTTLAVDGNFLDRDTDNNATLSADLIPRWQGRMIKSRANQRDGIAPTISVQGGFVASGANTYTLSISVTENSYPVNAANQGMPVFVSGGSGCALLQISDVRVASGTTTLTVLPGSAGIYEGCVMHLLDHGQNFSNGVDLPVLGYNLGEQAVCFDKNLTISQQECRLLWDLRVSTSGAQRSNKNNRWQNTNVTSWFGVDTETIDGQEHVVSLLLHRNDITSLDEPVDQEAQGNNLQGSLPTSLTGLTKLRYFKGDHNKLVGPLDMMTQPQLEILTVSNNNFAGALPAYRASGSLLREIDLSHNAFEGGVPAGLRSLKSLKSLFLDNNQLSGRLDISTNDWGKLEVFSIANNAMTGGLDPDRSAQSRLEKIDFSSNHFAGTIPSAWSSVSGLKEINLSHNNLSGPIPTAFSSLNAITHFLASGNALIGNINDLFPSWTTLKHLDITNNRFTGKLSSSRGQLVDIQTILIAKNALDRDSDHNALIDFALTNRWESRVIKSRENQDDITPVVLSSPTTVLSPVAAQFYVTLQREENSYTVNDAGTGLLLGIDGPGLCTGLLLAQTQIATGGQITGSIDLLLAPTNSGVYTCFVTVQDHGGNVSRLPITPFLFDASCGNGSIDSNEQCDEGRFCATNEQLACTTDGTVCPFDCVTSMVDNCTPACKQSVCGDRYIDTNGLDNTLGTQDDEVCDVGSFCPDGRDCTNTPSICSGGPTFCQTRFTTACSPVCAPSSCGDGVLDEEEEEDCDDANTVSGDGCSSSCKVEYCGDGLIDANGADQLVGTDDDEACDVGPGNGLRAGQCNQFCKINEQTCQWCFETCQGGTGNHSIFLLIDVSGSMEGNKMQKAKQGAQEFVQRVLSGALNNSGFVSKIGLIKFSSNGTIVQTPTTNYTSLISAIQNLQPGGSTNFGDPINKAKTYFATNDTGFSKHIILLSDGLPTVGTNDLSPEEWSIAVAEDAKSAGTNIYTIAVEQTEEGIELMRTISSASYVNLAIDKTVSQSSTQSNRSATRAIDSDKSNYSQTRSDAKAWWQIDLGSQYGVREVKVWNRSNLGNETSNFYVLGSPTPFSSTNLATTLAQSGVIATYFTGTAQRPSIIPFDASVRYMRIQLAGTNRLQLAELEIFGCLSEGNCDMVFNYEDYTSEMINTLYGHIFGSIHCGCGPYQVCGICGDGNVDATYAESCDEGSFCDNGTDCSTDPSLCPTECRPRTSQTCTNLCKLPYCGDGVIQTGYNEQCDDTNQRSGDGCSATCLVEFCGDGIVDINGSDATLGTSDDEQCDDGNTTNGDGCSTTCKAEICGDGQVTGTEQCDEGRYCDNGTTCTDNPWICPGECKTRATDLCSTDCTYGSCGDGITDTNGSNNLSGDSDDEMCDPGKFCPNGIPCTHDESLCPGSCEVRFTTTCTQFCKLTYCGDGYVDLDGVDDDIGTVYDNEYCDDGNNRYGDGCSPTCLLESTEGLSCGDGIKQAFELCDYSDSTDPLYASCSADCIPWSCGDGIVHGDEACDTGKWCADETTNCTNNPSICPTGPTECQTRNKSGCTQDCEAGCGNGIVDANGVDDVSGNEDDEQCDDGDSTSTDSCTNDCRIPVCGDGIVTHFALIPGTGGGMVHYMETCDDTNTQDNDTCPSTCTGTGQAMAGVCVGSSLQSLFYDNENTSFADISVFCDRGIPDGSPIYDVNTHTWQWVCLGILGGENAICQYDAWSCGDGVVDTRTDPVSGISVNEECDDGNTQAGDGCTASCLFESPLLFNESGQCSTHAYPAIQSNEYLPAWWESTPRTPIATGLCAQQITNTLINPQDMHCDFVVTRGNPGGYEQTVGTVTLPCIGFGSGLALVQDAIQDKGATLETVLGGGAISPSYITQFSMDTDGSLIYGQYRLSLESIRFQYCAKTRTQSSGTPQLSLLERTFQAGDSPMCHGQRSLSPSYFMHHTMLFSEQANTGLNAKITNISGQNIYLADTSYTKLQKSTYGGSIKNYLFEEFVSSKTPLATKSFRVDSKKWGSRVFQKIPNSYTFVYQSAAPLTLDRQTIGYLLSQAGIALQDQEKTPFTLIVSDKRVTTTLVGDMPGQMMLVTNGDIIFAAENCDKNDEVQGIYVTNGAIMTTKTVNDRLDAMQWCNGGGLTIQGLLLGRDLATTLGGTRRSSIHFWEHDLLYPSTNNVSYIADQYYTACVQPSLLFDTLYTTMNTGSVPYFGHPIDGCLPGTIAGPTESTKSYLIDLLLRKNGYFDRAFHENNTALAKQFIKLLPSSTTSMQQSPLSTIRIAYGNKSYVLDIPSWKMQQITTAKKQLPDFFTESINLDDAESLKKLLTFFEPTIGYLQNSFQSLAHPYQKNDGQSATHAMLAGVWGDTYLNRLQEQSNGSVGSFCQGSKLGIDGIIYDDQKLCQLTYSPVYAWLINARKTYKENKASKESILLQGAGVQVIPAPTLRQNPPPGALDIFSSLIISR